MIDKDGFVAWLAETGEQSQPQPLEHLDVLADGDQRVGADRPAGRHRRQPDAGEGGVPAAVQALDGGRGACQIGEGGGTRLSVGIRDIGGGRCSIEGKATCSTKNIGCGDK